MIPTVQRQIRKIAVVPENLRTWAGEELIPFLAEVRQALNFKGTQSIPPFVTSGTGVATTIWESADIGEGSAIRIDADAMGVTSSASAKGCVTISGLFYNDGTTQQEGATATILSNNPDGFGFSFLVVGNHVELQVNDTGLTVTWRAVISAQEAP